MFETIGMAWTVICWIISTFLFLSLSNKLATYFTINSAWWIIAIMMVLVFTSPIWLPVGICLMFWAVQFIWFPPFFMDKDFKGIKSPKIRKNHGDV